MCRRTLAICIVAIGAPPLAACGAEPGSSGAGPQVVTETRGDTTVVRTLAGSVWGADATLVPELSIGEMEGPDELLFGRIASIAVDEEGRIHVLDGQALNVRVFDPTGEYIETLGGPGEGPGELRTAESVVLLADGRVAVNDQLGFRVQVYRPGGGETEAWSYSAGGVVLRLRQLYAGRRGRTFVVAPQPSPSGGLVPRIIVFDAGGAPRDTLLPPGGDFEPPSVGLELAMGAGRARTISQPVPLTARRYWTLNPDGRFVTGISTDYRIDVQRDDGVLRIERAYEPVAASEAERTHHREQLTRALRVTQPDWEWNGPPIPETKPPFRGLVAGRDGRIWVRLWTEAFPEENEDHDPGDPRSERVTWPSPLRYDVFEPDGTYLGAVNPPEGFADYPQPVFDGDEVWAVTRDAFDVERVVRFRFEVGSQ
ncbi:6-bladed beta-propeller [Candidatus Palauibacter sp.]|uniref:6-bladed beta-propeller n=1 Tax=Candidatus Palauibacter sp. TaxID=3101350 RepID=UPI003B017783